MKQSKTVFAEPLGMPKPDDMAGKAPIRKPQDQPGHVGEQAADPTTPHFHPHNQRRRTMSQREDSDDENTSRVKRQHLDDTSNDGPGSHPTIVASPLQLPHPSDSPATLTAKLNAILAALASGQGLAAATGFLATPNSNRDHIAKACQDMHPEERMMWDEYTANPQLRLPAINWKTDIDAEPTSTKPLKTAKRRAEALNRLYKTDQARPGHVVWLTKNHLVLLPLVKAVARIIGAETDISGGRRGAAVADLQTVNKILGVLGAVVEERKGEIDGAVIARVQTVLGMERKRQRKIVG